MLSGLKVIEFEGLGPAPFAGMMLADLGADVIVIHRETADKSPAHARHNLLDRGKRSILLNLKNADEKQLAHRLVCQADGLIEGFRPGVMERLGLGPEDVMQVNPRLVYGRVTGWGQTGPLAQAAGHDLNYLARSGGLWYASNAGETPFPPPTLLGDVGGGALYLVIGILAALLTQRATGKGAVIDAAMVDGTSHMLSLLMSLQGPNGLVKERGKSLLDGPHFSRTYACRGGGYISVQCLEPQFYAAFLKKLGLQEDAGFCKQFEPALWPELTARLAGLFAQKPASHWDDLFAQTDACVAKINAPQEAQNDPHIQARQIWSWAQGLLQAAPAPRFSTWAPEALGEIRAKDADRSQILAELNEGISDARPV